MKRKIIIANWKMRPNLRESQNLVKGVLKYLKKSKKKKKLSKLDIVVCPSFTSLSAVPQMSKFKVLRNVFLGAQDCFWEEKGEFTGEISPAWLKEVGCKYVILGHSERRRYLSETDEMVHKKIKASLNAGLIPIICVGETLDQRRRGLKEYVILEQVSQALSGVSIDKKQKIIIAYEPVWVIGSGHAIGPEEAEYMNKIILQRTIDLFPLDVVKNNIRVVYGGSVDHDNVKSFVDQDTVDGALVGGASLKAKEFIKICEAIC
ncbi:triose-phosphate isomerase [Patescibacteria group bacterium AH-259-L05]|nr:triose-phosphate isomerase [Patescibacteria group bacterium AH-259-L05]